MVGGGVPNWLSARFSLTAFRVSAWGPLVEDFIQFYSESLTVNTTLYEGARDLLERFHSEGRRLGVCTNKRHD